MTPTNLFCQSTHRTVLVTGAARGIGRAVALAYARNGWDVIGHYLSSTGGASTLVDEIGAMGRTCHPVRGDLSSNKGISSVLETIKPFEIHALINNAGSYVVQKHFADLTYDDFVKTFSVNSIAPALMAAAVFDKMKKNKFGRMVNISSIACKYGGSSHSLHYGCSKLALEGISKTLSKEGARSNILVNSVRPGLVDTDFHRMFSKNMSERVNLIPMKRMGTVAEIADMVYFLGSEQNTYITNETISIAGGE